MNTLNPKVTINRLSFDVENCRKWIINQTDINAVRFSIVIKDPYWHWAMLLAILSIGKECISFPDVRLVPDSLKETISVWIVDSEQGYNERELFFNLADSSTNCNTV
jgi:hypothetical protein